MGTKDNFDLPKFGLGDSTSDAYRKNYDKVFGKKKKKKEPKKVVEKKD